MGTTSSWVSSLVPPASRALPSCSRGISGDNASGSVHPIQAKPLPRTPSGGGAPRQHKKGGRPEALLCRLITRLRLLLCGPHLWVDPAGLVGPRALPRLLLLHEWVLDRHLRRKPPSHLIRFLPLLSHRPSRGEAGVGLDSQRLPGTPRPTFLPPSLLPPPFSSTTVEASCIVDLGLAVRSLPSSTWLTLTSYRRTRIVPQTTTHRHMDRNETTCKTTQTDARDREGIRRARGPCLFASGRIESSCQHCGRGVTCHVSQVTGHSARRLTVAGRCDAAVGLLCTPRSRTHHAHSSALRHKASVIHSYTAPCCLPQASYRQGPTPRQPPTVRSNRSPPYTAVSLASSTHRVAGGRGRFLHEVLLNLPHTGTTARHG